MRALSLWQPWASLIGHGKQFETRSWSTSYRGPIAIHAAKFFPREHRQICFREPYFSCLSDFIPPPTGCFVAIAELTGVFPTEEVKPEFLRADLTELTFGDYSDGRFAWKLENIRQIAPIPAKGTRGLWRLDEDTALLLESRVINAR